MSDPQTSDPPRFTQVTREPTLSDKVVASITSSIMSGRLKPGHRLESERDLAEQFGVSRTVVREAVRSLTAQGLVETRSGRGIQVSTVTGDAVSRSMGLFLKGNAAIDYGKIHEVRSALEITIAGLAAQRATEDDLARMTDLIDRMREPGLVPGEIARLDLQFHRALAVATQNDLFTVMLDSIGDQLLEVRRTAFETSGVLQYAISAHQEILDRVRERDAEAAEAAMRAHLETSERAWASDEDE
jgi:GntR family transcriptional repressor for pyruvate dehydrogenase complex